MGNTFCNISSMAKSMSVIKHLQKHRDRLVPLLKNWSTFSEAVKTMDEYDALACFHLECENPLSRRIILDRAMGRYFTARRNRERAGLKTLITTKEDK
jgi:hypothetical protein